MGAVVVRNTRAGDSPVESPRTPEGDLYPFCMFYDGYKFVAFASSPGDLLDVLIPGYAAMDDAGQQRARIRLAHDAQVALQAVINAETAPEAMDALSAEQRATLFGPRFEQPRVDVWEPSIVLVLVETGYAPITDIPQPISGIADVQNPPNMLWLRPAEEWEFLTSLADSGFIGLSQKTDM
jgi:hypothetical protein